MCRSLLVGLALGFALLAQIASSLDLAIWQPFCEDDPDCGWAGGYALQIAANLMVEHINREGFLFGGETLKLTSLDTACSSKRGIEESVSLFLAEARPFGIVGCGCSRCSIQVAPMLSLAKIPMVSQSSSAIALSDRTTFPHFFRTILPDLETFRAMLTVLNLFDWYTTCVVFDANSDETQREHMDALLAEWGLTDLTSGKTSAVLEDSTDVDAADSMVDLVSKTRTRSVVAVMWEAAVRMFLCRLTQSDADEKMFLITFGWFPSEWLEVDMTGNGCSQEGMVSRFEFSILTVTMAWNADLSLPVPCGTTGSSTIEAFKTAMMTQVEAQGVEYSSDTTAAPDAVCMFAMAYNAMREQNYSQEALYEMSDEMFSEAIAIFQKTSFEGVSGSVSYPANGTVDGAGDRLGSVELKQTINGTSLNVAVYNGVKKAITMLDGMLFRFTDGSTQENPPDALFACSGPTIFNTAAQACLCVAGYYQRGDVGDGCIKCSAGTYTAVPGEESCSSCAAGQYQNETGATECWACPRGTYTNQTRATQCDPCPEGTSTYGLGYYSLSACGCPEDSYMTSSGLDCIACGEGALCEGYGAEPLAEPGYMLWEVQDSGLSIFRCSDEEMCPGGAANSCAVGREGRACAQCYQDWTQSDDGSCRVCRDLDKLPLVGTALAIFVGLCIFYRGVVASNHRQVSHGQIAITTILSQFLSNGQVLGAISKVNVDWQAPLQELLVLAKYSLWNLEWLRLSCFGMNSTLWRYSMGLGCVLATIMAPFLMNLALNCWSCFRRTPFDTTTVHVVVGVLMQGFAVAIFTAILAPLLCLKHPNGLYTLKAYPATLCWEGGAHNSMLVMAAAVVLFPLGHGSGLAYVTWHFNGAVSRGDVNFIHRWSYIFARVKPAGYSVPLLLLLRSWAVVLSIVPNSPIVQIALLLFLMLFWLCRCLATRPYLSDVANVLEAVQTAAIVLLLGLSPAFIRDAENQSIASEAAFALFIAAGICLPVGLFMAVRNFIVSLRKPYAYFLSHHKNGAGAFARLLKLELSSRRKVEGDIFLDSDNLIDLNELLDIVAFKVQHVLVLVTDQLFMRPWCLAELAISYQKENPMITVYFPNCDKPSDSFIESLPNQVLEIHELARFGLTHTHLQEALAALQKNRSVIHMSRNLTAEALEDLASIILRQSAGPPASSIQKRVTRITMSMNSDVISEHVRSHYLFKQRYGDAKLSLHVVVDGMNMEAVSSALILQRLIPLCSGLQMIPDVLAGSILPQGATKCVLLCSASAQANGSWLESVVVAVQTDVFTLPVFLSDEFRIPSDQDLDRTSNQFGFSTEKHQAVLNASRTIFRTIGVRFWPKEHYTMMRAQVNSIVRRMQMVSESKSLCVTSGNLSGQAKTQSTVGQVPMDELHRDASNSETESI